jgi:hypothetical protein
VRKLFEREKKGMQATLKVKSHGLKGTEFCSKLFSKLILDLLYAKVGYGKKRSFQ